MDGIHSQQGGSSEHLILEVRGGKRGLTSSMIDDETYFVSMRCGGTRNERSSGTLVESLHSYESQKCRPVGYFSKGKGCPREPTEGQVNVVPNIEELIVRRPRQRANASFSSERGNATSYFKALHLIVSGKPVFVLWVASQLCRKVHIWFIYTT